MSYEEAKRIRLEKMKKIFQLYSEGEREKAKEATEEFNAFEELFKTMFEALFMNK